MQVYKTIFALFFILGTASANYSQTCICTPADSSVFEEKMEFAKTRDLFGKPTKEIFFEIAKSFIGTEYKAHTIENENGEKLKINFTGLDCYTFVETSLAFARIIHNGDTTFAALLREIENIRYRNGKRNGYASRLHYFTDWIYDLSARGIIRDKTKDIGGYPYEKKIDFMSAHPNAYAQLKDNPQLTDSIKFVEQKMNARDIYYIPQDCIENAESKIESGDIIAITTSVKGLDVSHVGIAYKKEGKVFLLHAPNVGYKVQISEKPLDEYIRSHKIQTGIIVAEPL